MFKLFFSLVGIAIAGTAASLLIPGSPPAHALVQSDTPAMASVSDMEVGTATDKARVWLDEKDARLAAKAHLLPEDVQSILATDRLNHGEFLWNDDGVGKGKVTVWVDLRRQLVSVFRGPHEIGTSVILYGKPGKDTPLGTFAINRKVADYHSRSYDAPMPHSMFITNDGVALHGSDVRLGRATHGCVGLPPEFARLLFEATRVGDKVTVVMSDAGATAQMANASS